MAKHPEELELRKGIFTAQFQEIGNSGVEINPENVARGASDQLSDMGDGTHFGREIVSNEERLPKKEESIIRPKRLANAGSLG